MDTMHTAITSTITTIGTVRPRNPRPTMPMVALPMNHHPIWAMGFKHVEIAYAICTAFVRLHMPF